MCRLDGGAERSQSSLWISVDVNPSSAPITLRRHVEVAVRLRSLTAPKLATWRGTMRFATLSAVTGRKLSKRRRGIHLGLLREICAVAASATFSGVNPYFVSRSLSGADEPNECMPMVAPLLPT
jgi:hypothetical protein